MSKVPETDERVRYAREVVATGWDPLGRYAPKTTARLRVVWSVYFIATEAGIEALQAAKPNLGRGNRRILLAAEFPDHLRAFLRLVPGSRVLSDYQREAGEPDPAESFVRAGYALQTWVPVRYDWDYPIHQTSVAFARRVLARRDLGAMGYSARETVEKKEKTVKQRALTECEYAQHRENYDGLCLACGQWTVGGVEPDARAYPCALCDARKVYGVEELVLRDILVLTED